MQRKNSAVWQQNRPGERFSIRVAAAESDGIYSLVEIVSGPGDGTPMHVHLSEDEHAIVLEGTATIALGEDVLELRSGSSMTLPKGIPHAWANCTSDPLRILFVAAPGGCEEILCAKPGDQLALAEKHRIQLVGPPPFDK